MGRHLRFFRSTLGLYESLRGQLDAAYGYPNAETKTETSIPPGATLPTDRNGLVYLAVMNEFCDYVLPSEMLPQLLASGAVEELTAQAYFAVADPA